MKSVCPKTKHFVLLLGLLIPSVVLRGQSDEELAFFEERIRPVLAGKCYACHSQQAPILMGGLQVDTREGIRGETNSGYGVIPYEPAQSLILKALRYDSSPKMPPDGKLPDNVIRDLVKWIEMGAPDPRGEPMEPTTEHRAVEADAKGAADHWAFQPIMPIMKVPQVENSEWPRSDIDRFVLARLEAEGLTPVGDTDRYTLLRRISFALTGLPPTPVEIEAFVEDESPQAYEKVVDRLLMSERFGERWGRHWLDAARFADVRDGSNPRPWPNAWVYRNYVIDAFNNDTPYDQFVREQIAGDLLLAENNTEKRKNLAATGFLALATRDLTERDGDQIQMDGIADQLDTVGRSMLGLSIGCARCHDHKFDPIPTRDYYAMAGILKSTATTIVNVREGQFVNDKVERRSPGFIKIKLPGTNLEAAVAQEQKPELIGDMPIHLGGSYERPGEIVPRGFIRSLGKHSDVSEITSDQSGRLQMAEWILSEDNPLTTRVVVNQVWQKLFGEGLVTSVDNFGTTGEEPTHPRLLDYLALRFRNEYGWSYKSLIREIVLSKTWRLSGTFDSAAFEKDPENRLLWRMSRRRLDAEALHDALLAVSGELLLERVGSTVPAYKGGNQFDTSTVPIDAYTMRLRAVYAPVFRKGMPADLDYLSLFDFPDPRVAKARRDSTTVPPQALYLMNSKFVQRRARVLAARLLNEAGTDGTRRVARAFLKIYGREATTEEIEWILNMVGSFENAFIEEGAADPCQAAWARVFHTLLISNEFLTVS